MDKNKIFLGGTCNETTWREEIEANVKTKMFNPVVDDWTYEAQKKEIIEKEKFCNIHLYVITKEMTGVFSIAEVVDSSHKKDKITFFHVKPEGFKDHQLRSLKAVGDLVKELGTKVSFDDSLETLIVELNEFSK